jgi:5'-AMP-activated protein kinase catalytic alpha subunit
MMAFRRHSLKRNSINLINSINTRISEIHFKVTRKLGEGMFSTVKLATHSLTEEQVAIKILEKTRITKLEDKERIYREISIMKKLHHFNIAKLYQVVENKLDIYLIQEHIPGKEFMEYLTKKGKLGETEACKFYHQIISGLEYIHQCGIAHRDFKPENILITNDNTILKIIDFGLSNTYKDKELLKTACGSPCYAPPEMIKEEKYNGALTDIWSSGIILYLMLCGKLPFYHEENDIMYEKILSGKFELPDHLSDKAKDILTKILEVDPKKRFNFEQIKEHPWFNIIDKNYLMYKGVNVDEDIMPIDEEIINDMEKMGFNKMEMRYSLIKNFHNKVTTVYDLLLKKKIERGKKSVADKNSDLFIEYINDEKNKIKFYGTIQNALKHRICDDNKTINILPNYYEDKYDEFNDDIIVGDTGSVIERLIKAGRFTYDEENMCLNKVSGSNKAKTKKENRKDNNDGDSKFKTVSQMQTKPKKIQKENTETEEKKNKVKSPKVPSPKKSPNKPKKPLPNKSEKSVGFQKRPVATEKKEDEEEDDNDWYKEIEAMITGEDRKSSFKQKKSASLAKRKVKIEEKKNETVYLENTRKSFSNRSIKTAKTKKFVKDDKKKTKFNLSSSVNENVLKPSKTKVENTNTAPKHHKVMSTKLNTNNKDLNQNGTKKKKMNNSVYQSSKTNKYMKIVKKDDKKLLKSNKVKKFEPEDDSEDEDDIPEPTPVVRKRGLSCTKRSLKSKFS